MNRLEAFSTRVLERITGKYETISHICVDASDAPCAAGMSPLGFPIFVHEFEVIYMYGQTEFKAQIAWKEEVRLPQTFPRAMN